MKTNARRGIRTSSFFCPLAQTSKRGGSHSASLAMSQTVYSPSGIVHLEGVVRSCLRSERRSGRTWSDTRHTRWRYIRLSGERFRSRLDQKPPSLELMRSRYPFCGDESLFDGHLGETRAEDRVRSPKSELPDSRRVLLSQTSGFCPDHQGEENQHASNIKVGTDILQVALAQVCEVFLSSRTPITLS